MTKSRDNKQAIRAYMRTHGVNYTTAKRALREQAERNAHIRWALNQDTDTVHSVTVNTASDEDGTGAVVPLIKNNPFATPVENVTPCPDCGHGTSDGRLACDPDCTQGRRTDLPADLRWSAQVEAGSNVNLTGRCVCTADEMHAGHRDDCPERLKAFPPRTADEAAAIVHPPVTLDMARASFAERVRHPHIHDLDGRCAKNRNGNFCPPATKRVAIGVDPDHEYVHTVIQTINDLRLPGGLGTGEPDIDLGSDLNASIEAAARNTTTATGESLPDGATVRHWRETARHPETGERVPAVVTHVLFPADENGHRKAVTTRTLITDSEPLDDGAAIARAASQPPSGEFCERHFSWLCQAGQGKCSAANDHPANDHPATGVLIADEAWALMPHQQPSRRNNLKKALATGNEDVLNAHLREHAPGPHIDDLHAALEQLASLELELREHTDDPESPVTYEMLRHAILATTTHGTRWGGGKWHTTAADVCRSYLLAVEVTTNEDTPEVDGQYRVQPEDLAGVLEALADDDTILDEAAHGTAADADDIAEELLILASNLCKPATTPNPPSSTSEETHYLVVTEGARYVDRRYIVDCASPTKGRGSCEGWEECDQCSFLTVTDDEYDTILDTGTAHGVEHIMLSTGPAIATGQCALQAFPEAWEESDAILNLPPGRYAINSKWEDEYCTIWLRTH